MSNKSELSIAECIRKLSPQSKVQTLGAKVVSVDANKGLCTVLVEILELEFDDIRLTAFETDTPEKALLVLPKVGSYVLIGRIEGSDYWYLAQTTEVDEIRLGGKRYSEVKGETLQSELIKDNTILNVIYTAFKDGSAPTTADGGIYANALLTALKAALAALPIGEYSQILNDKVKHGE